jgi:predicted nicotinamide N-methyase
MVTSRDESLAHLELSLGGRTWSLLCAGALLSREHEKEFFHARKSAPHPYGTMLWPAAIALAEDVSGRELAGKRVLELGAGTGLPGIVAASRGACVVQTDHQELVLDVCRRNAARNGITTIEYRAGDWTTWDIPEQYDVVLGADIRCSPSRG